MESTTPRETKYPRLQAKSTRVFSGYDCDAAVIAET